MPNSNKITITYFKFPELYQETLFKLSKLKNFRYVIGQIEETKTKKPHLQGYIEFSKKVPFSHILKIIPGAHLEHKVSASTREEARDYCKKLESRIQPPIEYGEWIKGQGHRSDIVLLKKLVKDQIPIIDIFYDSCQSYNQMRIVEKLYEYSSTPRNPDTPPNVIWIYGKTGTGKTRYVYQKHASATIYECMDTFQWWCGYNQQEVILIDDMRKDFCKYHTLLRLLDRYPLRVQIKGGTRQINSKYIYITTHKHWKELYDTREDLDQLGRRITETINLNSHQDQINAEKRKHHLNMADTYFV